MAVVATLSKGYDLDYIWRQVDRGPALFYYLGDPDDWSDQYPFVPEQQAVRT